MLLLFGLMAGIGLIVIFVMSALIKTRDKEIRANQKYKVIVVYTTIGGIISAIVGVFGLLFNAMIGG